MLIDKYMGFISIHAPAKGATSCRRHTPAGRTISIHAPAKGATCAPNPLRYARQYFNPRSREGSDFSVRTSPNWSFAFQSTLPRRERPALTRRQPRSSQDFNPRSREGSDDRKAELHMTNNEFQSTLPRRERLNCLPVCGSTVIFQSTLPRRERRHLVQSHI